LRQRARWSIPLRLSPSFAPENISFAQLCGACSMMSFSWSVSVSFMKPLCIIDSHKSILQLQLSTHVRAPQPNAFESLLFSVCSIDVTNRQFVEGGIYFRRHAGSEFTPNILPNHRHVEDGVVEADSVHLGEHGLAIRI
jgi:hypothetical protein